MMKYAFYVTTSQSGGEGQGNIHPDPVKDIQMNITGNTGIHVVIETGIFGKQNKSVVFWLLLGI